jgi:hypothetical protein
MLVSSASLNIGLSVVMGNSLMVMNQRSEPYFSATPLTKTQKPFFLFDT